jgi:hypothetical protein
LIFLNKELEEKNEFKTAEVGLRLKIKENNMK